LESRRLEAVGVPGGAGAGVSPPHVTAHEVLAARRSLRPARSWWQQAETAYVSILAAGIAGLIAWGLVGTLLVGLARTYLTVWGLPAVFLLLLAALRYSTWQGFVGFSEPDCFFLLTAPVSRADLVWPRLCRALVVMGLAGALVGAVGALVAHGLPSGGARFALQTVGGFAYGVLACAGAWHVQRAARASRWVLRLTVPALGVAVLLGLAAREGGTAGLVALWSGPWGWVLLSSAADVWPEGVVGALILSAAAGAAWWSLRRTAGGCTLESFRLRASTRSRVAAALTSYDTRSVLLARRLAKGTPASRTSFWLPPPKTPSLVVAWRGSLALLRSPGRLAWSVVLASCGALLLAGEPGRPAMAWLGSLVVYFAAASLLEPLRLEVDSPIVSHVLLPWRYGRLLWLHCLLPTAILVVTAIAAACMGWAVGYVSPSALGLVVALAVPVGLTVVLAAALSARRGGKVPMQLIIMTGVDSTGLSLLGILAWMGAWAIAAITLVAAAAGLLASALSSPGAATTVVTVAAAFLVLASLLQRLLLASRK
jgi:hypothetical protein